MKKHGWTKERLEKFRATMKAKKFYNSQAVVTTASNNITYAQVTVIPLETIIKKWNREANKAFAALAFETKAALLAQVKQ